MSCLPLPYCSDLINVFFGYDLHFFAILRSAVVLLKTLLLAASSATGSCLPVIFFCIHYFALQLNSSQGKKFWLLQFEAEPALVTSPLPYLLSAVIVATVLALIISTTVVCWWNKAKRPAINEKFATATQQGNEACIKNEIVFMYMYFNCTTILSTRFDSQN